MNKFGARWLQIAMAICLREALSILFELTPPQAIDLGSFFGC